MKRCIHLTESEMRNLVRNIIREVKEEKNERERGMATFLVCSSDFNDFDSILDLIEAMGADYEEVDDGVYEIRCKKRKRGEIKSILRSLSTNGLSDTGDFGGKRTCNPSEFYDKWEDDAIHYRDGYVATPDKWASDDWKANLVWRDTED